MTVTILHPRRLHRQRVAHDLVVLGVHGPGVGAQSNELGRQQPRGLGLLGLEHLRHGFGVASLDH